MTSSSVFQLIDFDRTLFDTSAFVTLLTDEINRREPGLGAVLNERFEAAYKNERTFFLLRYLRHEKGNEWFEQLVHSVVAKRKGESLLLPHVYDRLAYADTLTAARPSWGILTYGDTVDQYLKLRIAKLEDSPIYITNTPNKSTIIKSWQLPDGRFQLPGEFGGGIVDSLTFEDDKLRAFHDLPENVLGLWITQDDFAKDRVKQPGCENVIPVRDLKESMKALNEKFGI